jgi:hypothetical protein
MQSEWRYPGTEQVFVGYGLCNSWQGFHELNLGTAGVLGLAHERVLECIKVHFSWLPELHTRIAAGRTAGCVNCAEILLPFHFGARIGAAAANQG